MDDDDTKKANKRRTLVYDGPPKTQNRVHVSIKEGLNFIFTMRYVLPDIRSFELSAFGFLCCQLVVIGQQPSKLRVSSQGGVFLVVAPC